MIKCFNQRGVSLIVAVFIIVILAFMGVMFVSLINTASFTSVNDLQSARALYAAEGGLENATLLLDTSNLTNRLACGSVTGNANLTNEPLGSGQFTVTGGSVYSSAPTSLNGPITSAATTITVFSTANYAASGRIMIDRELMDYSGIAPGTTTVAVLRGRDGTTAAAHANGAPVGQYQCTITSQGGIPTVTSPAAMRTVTEGVQLQEGWAIGAGGNILRWQQTGWTSYGVVVAQQLNGISMLSYVDGWAVGNASGGELILHWNGNAWTRVGPSGILPNRTLYSIYCVSNNECYAVGAPGNWASNQRPWIVQYNGAWSNVNTGNTANANLNSVYCPASGICWAVGNTSGGELIYRLQGGAWSRVGPTGLPNVNLLSVFCTSALDCWTVGVGGNIFRWTGGPNWINFGSPIGQQLNSVFMLDTNGDGIADDGWAVGVRSANNASGWTFLRWNGASWNSYPVTTTGTNAQNLNKVSCVNANDCWAVGNAGMGLHWDGNSWALWNPLVAGVTQNLMNLHIIGPEQRPQAAWQEVFP